LKFILELIAAPPVDVCRVCRRQAAAPHRNQKLLSLIPGLIFQALGKD
jgi:hypothetical protein